MLKLSDRLQLIADEIKDDESVCDVGTDHGFLPIYLYEKNPDRKIIMSDVSKGSLEKCRQDCEELHPGTDFDLRLGSGIEVLKKGEVDCVVMAGMGGILISELLDYEYYHAHSIKKYILQPRRHIGKLRYFLNDNGYSIIKESLVREGKFIWPVLTVQPVEWAHALNSDPDDIEYEFPYTLIKYKNDLTKEYLENALKLEKEKLESKKSSAKTSFDELRKQEYRVFYLNMLINKL